MRAIAILALVLFLAAGGAASHNYCEMTTSTPEADTGPGPARFYIDNDPCAGCNFSLWIYMESNGVDGLQRGDDTKDDTCGGEYPSDTIIF